MSFSSIIDVATKLNNNKPLGTLEMGVLYTKIPENIKDLPPETGSTFYENALIKAEFISKQLGIPAIGDDSGLEVDALNGTLSMGMSSDYAAAIQEGATMVRVGTGIFGSYTWQWSQINLVPL